jgi:hypothetical protein
VDVLADEVDELRVAVDHEAHEEPAALGRRRPQADLDGDGVAHARDEVAPDDPEGGEVVGVQDLVGRQARQLAHRGAARAQERRVGADDPPLEVDGPGDVGGQLEEALAERRRRRVGQSCGRWGHNRVIGCGEGTLS